MGIWPAIIKNNLSKIIKQNLDEVLFVYLFLFCVALSSSTSSEAEDISSAFKGAEYFFFCLLRGRRAQVLIKNGMFITPFCVILLNAFI